MKRSEIYLKAYKSLCEDRHQYGCIELANASGVWDSEINGRMFPEFFLFKRRNKHVEERGWFGCASNPSAREHRKTAMYFAYIIAKSNGN